MAVREGPFFSFIFFSQHQLNKAKQAVCTVVIHHIPTLLLYPCSMLKINANILSVIIKLFFNALNLQNARADEVIRAKPFPALLAQKHAAFPGPGVPALAPGCHSAPTLSSVHFEEFALLPAAHVQLAFCLLLPKVDAFM